MATMSDVRTLMSAASAAFESRDYETARDKAGAALALIATVPDSGAGTTTMRFRSDIEAFLNQCEKRITPAVDSTDAAIGGGIQRVNIRRVKVGGSCA